MTGLVAWSIVLPLAGAIACLPAGRRVGRCIAASVSIGTVCLGGAVAWFVAGNGTLRHHVGGWGPPLGIDLRADGIAAGMLLAIGVVSALIAAHAGAPEKPCEAARLRALTLFAWASLNALVLSADVFNLYVTLELTTLASVALIAARDRREALRAAIRYLLFALPGSLLYLLGVAILYGAHAALDLAMLGTRMGSGFATWTALSLMTLGLCLKAALFPLHAWLAPAYVSAGPKTTALLSSVLGKAPFYVLLRVWIEAAPVGFKPHVGAVLGCLGAASVLWGSLLALRQRRMKALVAYSSIGQIGYLFVVFALSDTHGALAGGVYLAISHAAAVAAMFLAVATIHRTAGHDEIERSAGLARLLPGSYVSLAVAGVSLMGMPPSGGFVGKWLLVRAAFASGQWWWAIVPLGGGLLAAAYVFRILRPAFRLLPAEQEEGPRPHPVQLAPLALALIALFLGLAPTTLLDLLEVGRQP